MPRFTYGPIIKLRVKRLLEALLSFVNWEFDDPSPKIKFNWQAENSPRPKLVIETRLIDLEWLTKEDCYQDPEKLDKDQIREALNILKDFLKILEDNRAQTQGSETWHFTLMLWSKDKQENLKQFDQLWENCRPEKSKVLEESFQKDPVRAVAFKDWEIPEGSVSLDSPFYIERFPIESDCCQTILQPGALIRIKAPGQMGKTSLVQRILHHANNLGHEVVYLNLQSADSEFLTNVDRLLQWFCACITDELNLEDRLADYWKQGMGSKQKCSNYFQRYLLATVTEPLTLGLDEVDRVFQYREIAQEFFGLLRAWHEKGKNEVAWKKLRLVISHSKEVYIPLDINRSPFNVGLPIELLEFNEAQITQLVQKYKLNLSKAEIEKLIEMVGGHPYLLRKALYEIARGNLTLEKILQIAPTEEGLYGDHLRRHLSNLAADSNLEGAMKQTIAISHGVRLEPELAFKLRSMGLVKLRGNDVIPLCNLYRLYFRDRLGVCG